MEAALVHHATGILACLLVLVQLHATPANALPSCRFHPDVYDMYPDLSVRGEGTVTLHNITCMCHVGLPYIVVHPSNIDNSYSLSSHTCEGVPICSEMPRSCEEILENVFSKQSLSGTFNQTVVIECGNVRDSNKAEPFIVWVNPVLSSAPLIQPTSANCMTTTIMITTTITTTIVPSTAVLSPSRLPAQSSSSPPLPSPPASALKSVTQPVKSEHPSQVVSERPTTSAEVAQSTVIISTTTIVSLFCVVGVGILILIITLFIVKKKKRATFHV